MHIDNFDESTYLWLLEKMDVPYLPAEWNILRDKAYNKDPEKMNGMSVFGKYLSKMKLKQWIDPETKALYGWADSERLQKREAEKAANREEKIEKNEEFEAELQAKYEAGEISEAEYKTLMSVPTQMKAEESRPAANPYLGPNNPYNEQEMFPEEDLPDPSAELTQEDKIYLAMKWGRMYRLAEWVELERSYNEMMESFDIQDADTKNTLILLCKTTLKANQALDSGDIEGFQKLSKVQESLRKTAKFTAAQNKEKKEDYLDSIGELVVMCEKEGFIPRFATDIPQDKVDITLKDMQNYTKKLITQDLGFGQQIEDALRKIQIQKEMNERADAAEPEQLSSQDYENYFNEIEEQKEKDINVLNEIEEDIE